ncbi:MAG: hypothetical protein CFE46_12470 [Burkholderiales bacterium PBB6]|nr:MAG: hypothetical protein CFE46_12470 [Burkholderiales bacterium PBB6]
MWKLALGFAVFAGVALWVISKGGDSLDMGGEKHGADAVHAPDAPASAAVVVPAVVPVSPAASAAASAASAG